MPEQANPVLCVGLHTRCVQGQRMQTLKPGHSLVIAYRLVNFITFPLHLRTSKNDLTNADAAAKQSQGLIIKWHNSVHSNFVLRESLDFFQQFSAHSSLRSQAS